MDLLLTEEHRPGEAPEHPPLQLWGKRPRSSSRTPRSPAAASSSSLCRSPRSAAPGSGLEERSEGNPTISRLQTVARETAELHGAPPPERSRADTTKPTSTTATSKAPLAGRPTSPTLCTRRETGFPHPPAAGAADGGRGTHASPAAKVDRRRAPKKRLFRTVAIRGEGGAAFYQHRL